MRDRRKNRVSDRRKILAFRTPEIPARLTLALTLLSAVVYFYAIAFLFERGNPVLFWLLVIGEIFHLWWAATYILTIWGGKRRLRFNEAHEPDVDVFITVAGEPVEIVRRTAEAAKAMDYPNFQVYLLNDGLVANKPNWQDIERLAKELGINCITRTVPGGAKAGNVNNAIRETTAPLLAIFDADHVPHRDFLKKTIGYFIDRNVGFVQTPQFYANRDENYITAGAWEQQELFFGAIAKGKDITNSMFLCGTNMVIRRTAIAQAGGMCETNIAEDFLTSLHIHQRGWRSVYVPEVLSEGLAPADMLSYYKQQYRWARGSLEVVFSENPLFKRGLSWKQKIEYLASSSYYLSGAIVLMNAIFPLIFFFTGQMPFRISTMTLAAAFLPYIFLMIYLLQRSSNFAYTFRALAFSMSSFTIHLKAIWAVLTKEKSGFQVTSKTRLDGSFISLVTPHILYIALVFLGIGIAVIREGWTASLVNNIAWALFNVAVFVPFIYAALPQAASSGEPARAPQPSYDVAPEFVAQEKLNYITYDEHEDV